MKNKPLNITQGKAEARTIDVYNGNDAPLGKRIQVVIPDTRTEFMGLPYNPGPNAKIVLANRVENKATAELIAEAFNVANDTGLSPKMMQEQNEQLKTMLSILKGCYEAETTISGENLTKIEELLK